MWLPEESAITSVKKSSSCGGSVSCWEAAVLEAFHATMWTDCSLPAVAGLTELHPGGHLSLCLSYGANCEGFVKGVFKSQTNPPPRHTPPNTPPLPDLPTEAQAGLQVTSREDRSCCLIHSASSSSPTTSSLPHFSSCIQPLPLLTDHCQGSFYS